MTENIVLANRLMDMASALGDEDGLNKSTKDMLYEAGGVIQYLDREVKLAHRHNRQVQGLIDAAYGLVARVRMGQDYKEAREELVVAAFGVNDMRDEEMVNG